MVNHYTEGTIMTHQELTDLQAAIDSATAAYFQYHQLFKQAEGVQREHFYKIAGVFYVTRRELISIQANILR